MSKLRVNFAYVKPPFYIMCPLCPDCYAGLAPHRTEGLKNTARRVKRKMSKKENPKKRAKGKRERKGKAEARSLIKKQVRRTKMP